MSTGLTRDSWVFERTTSSGKQPQSADLSNVKKSLSSAFGVPFAFYDVEESRWIEQATGWSLAHHVWADAALRTVLLGGEPQFLADEDAIVVLALPLEKAGLESVVAVAPFVARSVERFEDSTRYGEFLGIESNWISSWIDFQPLWPTHAIQRMASALVAHWDSSNVSSRATGAIEGLSENLSRIYEEICLLHRLTQNLRISKTEEDLARFVLQTLADTVCAEGFAILFLPVARAEEITYAARTEPSLLQSGKPPFSKAEEFLRFVYEHAKHKEGEPIWLRNPSPESDVSDDPRDQFVLAPIVECDNTFGWIAAFQHREGGTFGSVEANLLASVGAILGSHCGNRNLYRLQAEHLASVVRALTSAIDAKDPYTCGHSDRVARIAVRLASECSWSGQQLDTIYMAGLLHDIGKIGVSDSILGKQGPLTTEEFEHVKRHPRLGHKILADIAGLAEVLPAVLHHHEQWDGRGYPSALAEKNTPEIARILAVADAYDAMTSDRPYRKGIPEEQVDAIFRAGAGRQWDPFVIEAFFRAREDLCAIVKQERANLSINVGRWKGSPGVESPG